MSITKVNPHLKSFIHYFISFFILKGTSFFLIPLYANYLNKNDYGLLIYLITFIGLLSLIADLGLNNGLYRYINDKESKKKIFSNTLFISFSINILLSFFIILFFNNLNFAYPITLFQIVVLCLSLLLSSFTMLNLTYLRIENESFKYFYISISQPIIHIFLFLCLIFFDLLTIDFILLSTLISNVITAINAFFSNKLFSFSLIDKLSIVKIIKYTFGTMISVLALYVLTGFDKFFLSYFLIPDSLADYSLIVLLASITLLSTEPISLFYFSNRFKLLEKNRSLFSKITSLLVVFNIWVVAFLLINGEFLFNILLPSDYTFNKYLFYVAVFSFHFKYLSTILNIGCYIGDNTSIVAKINLFVAAFVAFSYFIFIEKYGVLSVSFSYCFGYILILALNLHFSNKKLKVNYKTKMITFNYIILFLIFIFLYLKVSVVTLNFIAFILIFTNKEGIKYVKNTIFKTKNKTLKESIL